MWEFSASPRKSMGKARDRPTLSHLYLWNLVFTNRSPKYSTYLPLKNVKIHCSLQRKWGTELVYHIIVLFCWIKWDYLLEDQLLSIKIRIRLEGRNLTFFKSAIPRINTFPHQDKEVVGEGTSHPDIRGMRVWGMSFMRTGFYVIYWLK